MVHVIHNWTRRQIISAIRIDLIKKTSEDIPIVFYPPLLIAKCSTFTLTVCALYEHMIKLIKLTNIILIFSSTDTLKWLIGGGRRVRK